VSVAEENARLEALLERYIRGRIEGAAPDTAVLCADAPELAQPLRRLAERFEALDRDLGGEGPGTRESPALPSFPGFRTIERLGRGGSSDVYKLEDLTLGRVVTAKVLRPDSPLASSAKDFLREARALALFDDPRIVRLLELREGNPPWLLLEYVEGFELSDLGPSLQLEQRARIVRDVAQAIDRAHRLGLQHRDLKPSNILLKPDLSPKILDFGLSSAEPDTGHGVGTLAYMAPEQLDPERPIDARSDVYALGVVLYELICGALPYDGRTHSDLIESIRHARPRLPVEVDPSVPEPLQAVALQAMAGEPEARYQSAGHLALDLERYLDGRPVQARPRLYETTLARRSERHLAEIQEWERSGLVHSHEGDRLRTAYGRLEGREDDWIVQSRVLSFHQIALYLGVFLAACGGVLYFTAYLAESSRPWWLFAGVLAGESGVATLGIPFAALTLTAEWLYRRGVRAVAVAYYLAGAVLVPPLLLILLRESRLWPGGGGPGQLFGELSNRQLQVATGLAACWVAWLVGRTRTVALSACLAGLLALLHLTLLADLGLRTWVDSGRWDQLALWLLPFAAATLILAWSQERLGHMWLGAPLYVAAALAYVASLELVALDGRALRHLGLTFSHWQPAGVTDDTLLDTLAAMTGAGLLFYATAWLLEHRGTPLMRQPGHLLYSLSPFATLEPLAYLIRVGEYSRGFDWGYLALALSIALASRYRQRRSFFYAGITNTALALFTITEHYEWFDLPDWGAIVLLAGILALVAGLALERRARRRVARSA
jgi:serine/threonine protein kinase